MTNNFTYFSPTKVIFGAGTHTQVGQLIRSSGGSRVLIVYGSKRILDNGLMDAAQSSLHSAGLFCVSLGGVVPNPHLDLVYRGINLGKKEKIDFLLAVGGGSVIDTCKAIGYGLAEPTQDVWDLFAHTRKASACLPLGCILTIAASGSETSNSAVITNEQTGDKRSYNDDIARPRFAVMNPELTLQLPDYQTESGCTDIMMHTMERYFTGFGNMELTDALAEALLRTVIRNARILHTDPQNYAARAEVMWAGSLSHNGLTGCGNKESDFACHKMEHEMGGMFDVTHGAGLAAIWGTWARYVYRENLPRFVRFAQEVHGIHGATEEGTAVSGIEAQEAFFRSIGMPTRIRDLGILPTEDQIAQMASRCILAADGPIGSAKRLYEADLREIYRRAL